MSFIAPVQVAICLELVLREKMLKKEVALAVSLDWP